MLETNNQTEFISPSQNPAEPPQQPPRHGRGVRTGAIIGLTLLLAVIFVIGGFAGWVFASAKSSTAGTTASTPTATTINTLREAVVAKVKPSVVEVYVTLSNGAALGSGVIIDSRGYIVTNNHVVSGALSIQVLLSNGTKEPAQLTGTDAADDLAVLKIAVPKGGLSVATLGNASRTKKIRRSSAGFGIDSRQLRSSAIDRAQPVQPVPVATIRPDDECRSSSPNAPMR